LASVIQAFSSSVESIFELVFRSQAVFGALLTLAYSLYTMIKA